LLFGNRHISSSLISSGLISSGLISSGLIFAALETLNSNCVALCPGSPNNCNYDSFTLNCAVMPLTHCSESRQSA